MKQSTVVGVTFCVYFLIGSYILELTLELVYNKTKISRGQKENVHVCVNVVGVNVLYYSYDSYICKLLFRWFSAQSAKSAFWERDVFEI